MTRGSAPGPGPGAGDAHPTLAQQAGTAVSAAALRLAYTTGAPIVHAPPWPGASFTEEQPEPGAGIRIALALERPARAGVRVFIARALQAGMSWHQVGEALGAAELARAHGSSLGEAAWQYAAQRPVHLSGQPGEFRWVCRTAARWSATGARAGAAPPRTNRATPKAATGSRPPSPSGSPRATDPTKDPPNRRSAVNLCHDHLTCLPCSHLLFLSSHTMITCTLPSSSSPLILLTVESLAPRH